MKIKDEIKPASFRLPSKLLKQLRDIAERSEISQTLIVQEALKEKLEQLKGKKITVGLEVEKI